MLPILDFLMRHGYAVLLGWVFLEQAGLPVPSMPLLLAAGALAGAGKLNLALCLLACVFASLAADTIWYALGRKKESDAALSELVAKYHAGGALQIAEVYAFRNQSDEAFEWLDRAYAQRDGGLIETKVDPLLKSLHNDPRFAAFLKKLNLPN